MNFSNEILEKAKEAKTAEELVTMANENGIEITEYKAAKYFAELHKTGELSDDELENVAGGCDNDPCPYCGSTAGTSIDYNTKIWIDAVRFYHPIYCVSCHAQVDKSRIYSGQVMEQR